MVMENEDKKLEEEKKIDETEDTDSGETMEEGIIENLIEERDEYKDKYLRALANYENLRKRTQKEKEKIYNFALENAFRDIIPVLDDFERAYKSLKEENNDTESILEGMRIIHSKLENVLKNYDITPFNSEGDKFDPSKHEAIHVVPSEEEEGTILEEVERGYMIEEKVLRPAKVIVAKKEEEEEKEDSKDKDMEGKDINKEDD